jgi:RNA polymerase sigma-70 factor (ECF subfamily)
VPDNNKFIATAIKAGDEKVFGAFLAAEFSNVVHFINQYLRDPDLANDLAQETFISLWFSRESIDPDRNIRSYIFKIAKNKSLNQLREQYFACTDNLERRTVELSIKSIQSEQVDSRIMALELEQLIERTYAQLPETYRESFILSRKSGLTYEEIAKSKGLTVKTIEYHISKALKFFRKRLSNYLKIF